jgi:hypothetical protein
MVAKVVTKEIGVPQGVIKSFDNFQDAEWFAEYQAGRTPFKVELFDNDKLVTEFLHSENKTINTVGNFLGLRVGDLVCCLRSFELLHVADAVVRVERLGAYRSLTVVSLNGKEFSVPTLSLWSYTVLDQVEGSKLRTVKPSYLVRGLGEAVGRAERLSTVSGYTEVRDVFGRIVRVFEDGKMTRKKY